MSTASRRHSALILGLVGLCACGGGGDEDPVQGRIEFTPDRPEFTEPASTATPYTGDDPLVLQAQATYRTGVDLHRKLILRTCGPNNGVCHNSKEYPDMRTLATFAQTIGAPCNVQPGSWSTVFDRCEQLGDRFRFQDAKWKEIEVGWVDYVKGDPLPDDAEPDENSPGLHVVLHDPLPEDQRGGYLTGVFIRSFIDGQGNVQDLPFTSFQTRWTILAGRRHLVGRVQEYQADDVTSLMASGIVQGDQNRNGVFGFRTGKGVFEINPGKPEESYLVGRLRGFIQDDPVPGSRMPLANQPPSVPDMVALMCFIEGLDPDPAKRDPSGPIDYGHCSYTADPESLNLVGNGVTWKGRVQPLLQANCGGCHGGATPQAGLDLGSDNAYERLMQSSAQKPTLKLVQPGQPDKSYLWLKLAGDGSITGSRMPIDPLGGGVRPLSETELNDIQTWIIAGALKDG
ncbi:MAG: hypothetical protein IRZ16_15665 [Myxococcaceae bacterium]|nr:hypothetical protein [Myxococcaceae bacterium]